MTVMRWVIFLSLIASAYVARVVFIPIFLSMFLAMLFDPVVSLLVERGLMKRQRATTLVVSVFALFSAAALWYSYLSGIVLLNDLATSPRVASLADYVQRTAGSFDLRALLPVHADPGAGAVQKVELVQTTPAWFGFLLTGFGSIFEVFGIAIFVPLLLFYFLYDKENLVESLNGILGEALYLPTLNSELPAMIRAFFSANLLTALGLIATHAVAFYFLGFENWLPLSVITGFLNLLPIVGAPLAVIVPIGVGSLSVGAPFPYVGVMIVTLVLHFIFNNLVLPVLIGSRVNINTASLAVGLLFWSWLWGGIGFLIAIPMTALIKIFLESNSSTLPIANLMAARPMALLTDMGSDIGDVASADTPAASRVAADDDRNHRKDLTNGDIESVQTGSRDDVRGRSPEIQAT